MTQHIEERARKRISAISSSDEQAQLDALGPIVVGKDGSLSRVANWAELTANERAAAVQAITKRNARNRQRLLEEQRRKTEDEITHMQRDIYLGELQRGQLDLSLIHI